MRDPDLQQDLIILGPSCLFHCEDPSQGPGSSKGKGTRDCHGWLWSQLCGEAQPREGDLRHQDGVWGRGTKQAGMPPD